MAEHPIQGLMGVTMEKIHQMVDSNTIIGKPITTEDGTTILPVSKVSFGFASGGTDFAAAAALGQAALQAYFRPDDANIPHLARSFSQAGTGSAAQWSQLIRNLKVGQFLLSNGPGNHLVVTVPQRRGR